MSAKNGGPAFPLAPYEVERKDHVEQWTEYVEQPGMSLRDYFAGQALTSFVGEGVVVALSNQRTMGHKDRSHVEREATRLVEAAYVIADAMLKAREQK